MAKKHWQKTTNPADFTEADVEVETMKMYTVVAIAMLMTATAFAANSGDSEEIHGDCDHPPVITTQPQSGTAYTGQSYTFTIIASPAEADDGTLSYAWKRNGVTIPLATTSTLLLTNLNKATDTAIYTCVVTNSRGLSATSVPANLVVYNLLHVTKQPLCYVMDAGGALIESVEVFGEVPYTYQWYKNGTAAGNILPGKTSDQLVIANAQTTDSGQYFCYITDGVSQSVWTANDAGIVTVRPVGAPDPEFAYVHSSGNATTAALVVNQHGVPIGSQVMSPGMLPANPTIVGVIVVLKNGVNEYVCRKTVTIPADGASVVIPINGTTDFVTWDGDPVAVNLATPGMLLVDGYVVNPGAIDALVDNAKVAHTCNGVAMTINGAYVNWVS